MKEHLKTTFFLIILSGLGVLAAPTLYSADAVIEGPEKVRVGQFVTFDSSKSTVGDDGKLFWIKDPRLPKDQSYLECGPTLATAFETEGTYYLTLVAYDAEGHDFEQVEIIVGEPSTPPSPPPPPPSPGNYQGVRDVSDKGVSKLADPVTAKRIATAIQGATKDTLKGKIDEVLLTREDAQRGKDWLGEWRKPVSQEIGKVQNPDYAVIIPLLIESLNASQAQTLPSLYVYTSNNCTYCDQWKKYEYPKVVDHFEISFFNYNGTVPQFRIGNKTFLGYTSAETLINSKD